MITRLWRGWTRPERAVWLFTAPRLIFMAAAT